MLDRPRYLVTEAVTNLGRSGWGGLASVGTISVCFLIIGIFLLLTTNLGALVAEWKDQFQVTVFLDDRITKEQLDLLRRRIASEMAVKAVTFTSKEAALHSFKRELKGKEGLLEGLGENPLPASFQLRIKEAYQTPEALQQLAGFLTRLEGVEDVQYGQEWVDRLNAALSLLGLVGLSIGLALALAALLIVSNTIRLAVYARTEEIEIMRLVGATRAYIRAPFLLEGLLQGLLGSGLAALLLFGAYRATLAQLQLGPASLYGIGAGRFLPPAMVGGLIGAGTLLGGIGSAISVGRFLRS